MTSIGYFSYHSDPTQSRQFLAQLVNINLESKHHPSAAPATKTHPGNWDKKGEGEDEELISKKTIGCQMLHWAHKDKHCVNMALLS